MVALNQLYSQQTGAVRVGGSKFRMPLADIVHAELPGKKEEGRVEQDVKQFEEGLALEKELGEKQLTQSKDIALADLGQKQKELEVSKLTLAESQRQHEKTMTQRQREVDEAADQARKTRYIQGAGTAIQAGALAYEMAPEIGNFFSGVFGWIESLFGNTGASQSIISVFD